MKEPFYRIVKTSPSGYIMEVCYEHLNDKTMWIRIHELNDKLSDEEEFYGIGYMVELEK